MPAVVSNTHSAHPSLTKPHVASLSHAEIAKLSPAEMIEVIALADLPFARQRKLIHQSAETLRQLTHLACQCCRNQGY